MAFLTVGSIITGVFFVWPKWRNLKRLYKYQFSKKPEVAVGQTWASAPGQWTNPKYEVHYEITEIDEDEGWITFIYGTSSDDELEDSVETYAWEDFVKSNKLFLFSEHDSIEDIYWGELGGTDEDDKEESYWDIFEKKKD